MARIRSIKPEFFTSNDILSLTPLARLFYVSLWCEADREGRLKWDLETLKFRYLPKNGDDIQSLADELLDRGLVVVYQVEARTYACIPSFALHQVINNRESESVIPSRVKDACTRVSGEGKEGRKGKESASLTQFDIFWEAYPKKKSKGDAEKAWTAIKPDEHLADQILQAVQRAKTSADWMKESGKFIPYPASWLRDKGWLDELGSGNNVPIWERT